MTAEYTPDQTPPRQCPECGGLSGHTADCPNWVDDRAAVVAEALAAHRPTSLPRIGSLTGCTCDEWEGQWREHRAHLTAAILAALDGAPAAQVQATRASGEEA